jgi:O-antigen ligase
VLAGYLLPAMLLGLLVTGFALGTRTGGWTLLGIAAYLGALALIGGHNRTEMLHEPWQLRINAVEAQDRYREDEHPDGVRHLKKFWGEQQAALNAFRNKPLLGTGAGEYQKAIAQSYDLLGDIEEQRLEPDAQNGYLLAGVGTGLLGLAALLALFGEYFGLAWRARAASPWAAAMLGAITALLVLTLATNPWVRGTTVVVVALFAMIANSATEPPPERISQQEEIGCES